MKRFLSKIGTHLLYFITSTIDVTELQNKIDNKNFSKIRHDTFGKKWKTYTAVTHWDNPSGHKNWCWKKILKCSFESDYSSSISVRRFSAFPLDLIASRFSVKLLNLHREPLPHGGKPAAVARGTLHTPHTTLPKRLNETNNEGEKKQQKKETKKGQLRGAKSEAIRAVSRPAITERR